MIGDSFYFFKKVRRIILGSWQTTNFSALEPKALKYIIKTCVNSDVAFRKFKAIFFYIEFQSDIFIGTNKKIGKPGL